MSSPAPYLGQNCTTPYPRSVILKRWLWLVVQSSVFRWSPRPCHAFRARLLKMFGADIEQVSEVVIFPTSKISLPWNLSLASRSMIGQRVTIYNLGRVSLEYGANVSQNTHVCAGTHDFDQWSMPLRTLPITIGRNVWVAADVFIGPGVTIGELAIIGARSVVMKNMPAKMICVGNPCRPIKPREIPH